MFYKFIRQVARFVVWVVNGRFHIENKEALPEGTYVLVGPHRTWWDPIYFALAAKPREFMFMAKQELFDNKILSYIMRHAHAFPVNRKEPGPSAIKTPVKGLRAGKLSLIMFPSGSRYSSELKGGAIVIAKMANVPLVPAVYQGPTTLSDLFKHKKVTIRFGTPIPVDRKLKLTDENVEKVNQQIQIAFDEIDQAIDPNFHYLPPTKE